ncbi:23 kDa integral membrane protein-like [Anticarsia gemmatalis]|uniref:23 kDa integral membrane protein-like n=1 Tax=Anticarsia gemmatalis TaxID=129554 RepID=UPI003F76E217
MSAPQNNVKTIFNSPFGETKAMFNMNSMRVLMLVTTAILMIIAFALYMYGFMANREFQNNALFFNRSGMAGYRSACGLGMILGLTLATMPMIGVIGSFEKRTCMVNLYAVILILLFVADIAAVWLAITFDVSSVWTHFSIPFERLHESKVQDAVDTLQITFRCCGNSGYRDYEGIELPGDMATTIVPPSYNSDHNVTVPASCCSIPGSTVCGNYNIQDYGCKYAMSNMMDRYIAIITVLGFTLMFIHILAIIFTLMLARRIREMKSEKTVLAWQITEGIIRARQEDDIKKI